MFNCLGYSESNDGWQTPEQWLAEDANDPGHQKLSDDEIVAMVRREENDSENESDSDSEQQPTISHAEACKALVYSGWNCKKKLSRFICYWLNSGVL